MSRLIDADKLDDVITELIEKGWMITRNDYKRIDSVISEFPTVNQWIPCSDCERKCDKWENSKT